jgi:predicted DCC family thiol-disulfide oxidoreductase YuxK
VAALIYDDDCGFCRWSVARIVSWDRRHRMRPVRLRSGEADRLLGDMPAERRAESWHLVTDDGRMRSGGAAVEPLLRLLPGGTPLAAIAGALPGPTDVAYRAVARHRDRLGRLLGRDRCAIDPAEPRPPSVDER